MPRKQPMVIPMLRPCKEESKTASIIRTCTSHYTHRKQFPLKNQVMKARKWSHYRKTVLANILKDTWHKECSCS